MTLKEHYGFQNGYITIFKGDTFSHKDYFKNETCAKYSPIFKWYICSEDNVPDDLPEGIEAIKLSYEDVFINDNNLKDEDELKDNIDYLLRGDGRGKYVGEIGDTICRTMKIEKVIPMPNKYGRNYLHIMSDNDDDIFVWMTGNKLEIGKNYNITGTIKEHKEYRNDMQNILTRCNYEEV